MSGRLRILVTNDDGVGSPGIRALARAVAAAGHDVVVAAPLTEASGTSAAITVTEEDGAAIANLDLVDDETRQWDTAAAFAVDLLPALRDAAGADPSGEIVFNLNVPDLPTDQVRGLRRARMARFGQVQVTIAEVGQGFVRTALEELAGRLEPDTDLAWLAGGYACVTPLRGVSEAPDVVTIAEPTPVTPR